MNEGIYAIIEGRMTSSRLPGKTLMPIKDKPMLGILVDRIKNTKSLEGILVATSINKNDDAVEDYCRSNNIKFYRGSEDDVLERVLMTAKHYNARHIVELTADCPLVDDKLIDSAVEFYFRNGYDFISTFRTRTFPTGYDLRIFPTKTLDEIEKITKDPIDRENVSTYINAHPELYKVGNFSASKELNYPQYRLVVDEIKDFELMKKIFENFSGFNFSIREVIDFLEKNPGLALMNKEITHKQYKMYQAGIIGLGRMGQLFEDDPLMKKPCTHAGAYNFLKDKLKLVAGCDVREDRLKIFADRHNIKRLYSNYKEMLKNEELDIVSICTHAPEHKDIVLEAAKSGVKAIFCEKPISTNLNDAEEMVNVCNENNVILYVDYTRRFDNLWKKSKELVDKGLIGDIKSINSFSTAGLLNGGSHLFDLLRFYNGDVKGVYGKLIRDKTNDASGYGILTFENNTRAFVDIDFRDYVLFQINLTGSKGLLKCGGMIRGDKTFELSTSQPSKTQLGLLELERSEFPGVKENLPLVNAVNDIIDSIETGKKPLSGGEEGIKSLEICMAFYESDEIGKEISLPLKNRNRIVIPRQTSYTVDGKFPECYERDNILPGF